MTTVFQPTTREIRDCFARTVQDVGGELPQSNFVGAHLLARAVLPHFADAEPGDSFQGGVAIRVYGDSIRVQPYTFRQVCRNGAIAAWILDEAEVVRSGESTTEWQSQEILRDVEHLVRTCADPDCLTQFVARARDAMHAVPDGAISMLSAPGHDSTLLNSSLAHQILRRFHRHRDRTVYGLMNAITSVARDTENPRTKWGLEELGGGMLNSDLVSPTLDGQCSVR